MVWEGVFQTITVKKYYVIKLFLSNVTTRFGSAPASQGPGPVGHHSMFTFLKINELLFPAFLFVFSAVPNRDPKPEVN